MPRLLSTREFIKNQLKFLVKNAKSEKQRVACLKMLMEMESSEQQKPGATPPGDPTVQKMLADAERRRHAVSKG